MLKKHRVWGGDRTGGIYLANQPFADRLHDDAVIEQDTIWLPDGNCIEGAKGQPLATHLPLGVITVALQNERDFFCTYTPVRLEQISDASVELTPFLEIRFKAKAYGVEIGRLSVNQTNALAGDSSLELPIDALSEDFLSSELQNYL